MKTTRYNFNSGMTQDEIDSIINSLSVDIYEFSKIACMEGRAYGVKTLCDECDYDLNTCVRNNLIKALVAAQGLAESELGYNITPRYHTQEITSWRGAKIQTDFPGIESVNVMQEFSEIVDFGPFDISPYMIEDIEITQDISGNFCVAHVDATLITNPSKVIIRDENNRIYPQSIETGYPRKEAGEWLIPLSPKTMNPACDSELQFNVQHCMYMILETAIPVCDGDLVPVYPGTNQIIPMAKPLETIDGTPDTYRWWFHPWVLVDEAFYGEEVDLSAADLYKLMQTIEFRCIEEVECAPVVTYMTQCDACEFPTYEDVSVDAADIRIVNAKNGILRISLNHCAECTGHAVKVRFCYKTNPLYVNMREEILYIKDAIAHLAASELPLTNCGCTVPSDSFIGRAMSAYVDIRINPVTGETVTNTKYGNLHGQVLFKEKLSKVNHMSKLVKA